MIKCSVKRELSMEYISTFVVTVPNIAEKDD